MAQPSTPQPVTLVVLQGGASAMPAASASAPASGTSSTAPAATPTTSPVATSGNGGSSTAGGSTASPTIAPGEPNPATPVSKVLRAYV